MIHNDDYHILDDYLNELTDAEFDSCLATIHDVPWDTNVADELGSGPGVPPDPPSLTQLTLNL